MTVSIAGRTVTITAEQHAAYVRIMRQYYESLPPEDQPEVWPDIREELEERDAIAYESSKDLAARVLRRRRA